MKIVGVKCGGAVGETSAPLPVCRGFGSPYGAPVNLLVIDVVLYRCYARKMLKLLWL